MHSSGVTSASTSLRAGRVGLAALPSVSLILVNSAAAAPVSQSSTRLHQTEGM